MSRTTAQKPIARKPTSPYRGIWANGLFKGRGRGGGVKAPPPLSRPNPFMIPQKLKKQVSGLSGYCGEKAMFSQVSTARKPLSGVSGLFTPGTAGAADDAE